MQYLSMFEKICSEMFMLYFKLKYLCFLKSNKTVFYVLSAVSYTIHHSEQKSIGRDYHRL